MATAYAIALMELDVFGPVHFGVPRAVFMLGLPVVIVAFNAVTWLLARQERWTAATAMCLVGDLLAVTIGLNGTGGVASWMWTAYPLITLEAAFLTESPTWTIGAAALATVLYLAEVALEDKGLLPTVVTPLTSAENQLPVTYWVLKDSWVALMNASAAVAGLVALRATTRVRGALKVAYRELDAQYEALRQLDDLKSQFLNVVSHELRTPLAIIQGYTELVEEDHGLSDDSRRYLDEAERAVNALSHRIEQMLTYSTLASGERGLLLAEVRAVEAVAEAVARREAACRAAGLVILMEPTPELTLRADEARLVEALAELIANACAATPTGGTVGVRTRVQGDRAVFEVWDTGPGMPKAVCDRLGEPFVQPGVKLTEHTPGLGLGLAYAQLVATLHGGALTVGDRPGGGAVVALSLPVASAAEGAPRPAEQVATSSPA
jgi:signal transduction histidine kinase